MNKSLTTILVIGLLVLAVSTIGLATEDSATTTVGWTINAQQSLYISSNGPNSTNRAESTFSVPEPTKTDKDNGYILETNAIELVAKSNVPFEIKVQADGDEKLISDLSVKAQDSIGFQTVQGSSPTTIADGGPGKHVLGVDYKVQYDETYESGNHEARLVYTISVG